MINEIFFFTIFFLFKYYRDKVNLRKNTHEKNVKWVYDNGKEITIMLKQYNN